MMQNLGLALQCSKSTTAGPVSSMWKTQGNNEATRGVSRVRCVAGPSDTSPGGKPRQVSSRAVGSPPAPTAVEAERLVPRVEERDGYWILKEEFRTSISPSEKIKIEKEPMKFFENDMQELERLAAIPFEELDANKAGKDDIDIRLKWLGMFHRRKHTYGRFMMRLKLPNGVTTSQQVRYLADVINKYGPDGCADITTRQNWQIRGVVLQDAPAIIRGLQEVGLTSIQSGMDNMRNAVGNPIAGVDPLEIVDTRAFNTGINDFIIAEGKGNPEFTNLPRKWNVCVVGTHDLFEHPHINDLAYMPAEKDGVLGFNMLVGGFFSNKRCAEAIPLDAWVSEANVVASCRAILETFRDLGFRGQRQKTRMMWLIDELGIEAFRAEVEGRMPGGALARAAEKDLVDPAWKRRSLFGAHPQKQAGLNFVGLKLPVGRLQADEMYELARLAEEYGSGEMRLTVEQNVIIVDVPDAKVEALLKEPLLQKFTTTPGNISAGLVACTGSQFCGQAIIETKANAVKLSDELEATMTLPRLVRMHWTGCPNTCAQVQVADIGFMGTMARDENKKPVEGVDIFMGGRIGSDSHLGDVIRKQVPLKDLVPVVQELLIEHFGASRK